MPFEVLAHPEDLPYALGSYEGGLGDRTFHNFLRMFPARSKLEYLNALALDSIAEIDLISYMRRRAALLYKSANGFVQAVQGEFIKGHIMLRSFLSAKLPWRDGIIIRP